MIPQLHEIPVVDNLDPYFDVWDRIWEHETDGTNIRVYRAIERPGAGPDYYSCARPGLWLIVVSNGDEVGDEIEEWMHCDDLTAQAIIHHLNERYFGGNT